MLNETKLAVKSLSVFVKLCILLHEILIKRKKLDSSCKNICFIRLFVKGNPDEVS